MAFKRIFSLKLAPIGGLAETLAGGIDVSSLRCRFHVKKTSKGSPPKPNHAVIEVYNLNTYSQAFLSNTAAISVNLQAGYEDEGTSQIYLGEVRTAETKQTGPDYVTRMSTDDKGRKLQTTQINVPVGAGATVETVIRLLMHAFNTTGGAWGTSTIGEGNLKFAMGELAKRGITSLYPRGGLLSGYAAKELTDLCRGMDLEWSIQDGALFLKHVGTAVGPQVLSFSGSSGLIGSPTIDNEGRMTAEMVMVPGITLGSVININSKFCKGNYLLTQVEYVGDTHEKDWLCRVHGEVY